MALTLVQGSAAGAWGASSGASGVTVSWNGARTAGSLLLLAATCDSTLSNPTGWTLDHSVVQDAGHYLWYRISDNSATDAPTVGAGFKTCLAWAEYSGNHATVPAGQSNGQAPSGGSTAAISTLTTAALAHDEALGIAIFGSSLSGTAATFASHTNGFAEVAETNTTGGGVNLTLSVATKALTSAEGVECSATPSASTVRHAIIGTYYPALAASGLYATAGTLSTGTAAAGNTVTVSGLLFDPSANNSLLLLSWTGRTAVGQGEGQTRFGTGYAISTTDRGGNTCADNQGATTMATFAQVFDDACIKVLTASGLIDGAMDFSAWNSDGFTLVVDDQFLSNFLVNWLLLSGSDLTNVASATVTVSATGGQDINMGFVPDAALVFGAGTSAVNTTGGWSQWCLGVAAGSPSSPANYVLAGASQTSQPTSVTMNYCYGGAPGECFAVMGADAVNIRGYISAFQSSPTSGFNFQCTENTGGSTSRYRVVCLEGPQLAVGDFETATNTTPFSETGVGFRPKALLVVSGCKAGISTQDTSTPDDQRSVGFAASSSMRNVSALMCKDAAGTSDSGHAQETVAVYVNQSNAATVATEGMMDLSSFGSDGFTVYMSDPDPAASFVWYLALAGAAVASAKAPALRRRPYRFFKQRR